MDRALSLGRLFFAASLVAFGVEQFLWGDFVPGRAPAWPASWPGRLVFAYVTGAFLIAAGASVALRIRARWTMVVFAALVLVWSLLRRLPLVAAAGPHLGAEWTFLGKALTFVGGALAIAGASPPESAAAVNGTNGFFRIARICLGAFMVLAGIQHFLFAEFVASLVPSWIPGAVFWTYLAAVALIAGGVGMNVSVTERPAAALSGLMIFLWVVMLHIPRAISASGPQSQNEWIAVFEALAFSGVALVLAGTDRAGRSL